MAASAAATIVSIFTEPAPLNERRTRDQGTPVGNTPVTVRDNPSRVGGSTGSVDNDVCTTVGAIPAHAARTNRAACTLKEAAIEARCGGGVKKTPANRSRRAEGDDQEGYQDASRVHGNTTDSRSPNRVREDGSGKKWPICEGPNGTDNKATATSNLRSTQRVRSASERGMFPLGGRGAGLRRPVIRAAIGVTQRLHPVSIELGRAPATTSGRGSPWPRGCCRVRSPPSIGSKTEHVVDGQVGVVPVLEADDATAGVAVRHVWGFRHENRRRRWCSSLTKTFPRCLYLDQRL